jgi:hypothetical protein
LRTVVAVTEIMARPRAVWDVLTDFPRYPDWSTYIQRVEGHAEHGTRIRVVLGPDGQRPYDVRTPVVAAVPGVRLAWAALIPAAPWLPAALFTGAHEFVLAELPDGGTEVTQREYFGGLVSRLSNRAARGADEGFPAFNEALKRRVLELGC